MLTKHVLKELRDARRCEGSSVGSCPRVEEKGIDGKKKKASMVIAHVCLSYLASSLDQHHFATNALKAGPDCQLDKKELSSIAVHILL